MPGGDILHAVAAGICNLRQQVALEAASFRPAVCGPSDPALQMQEAL
jgi:hypothetical protein